jgi:hypothetical protein
MQLTATEHGESGFAGTLCIDCHMPRDGEGKRTHRFDVSRNAEFLRSAITMTDARTVDHEVIVTIAPLHVGHAFPTGDMFRRLVVTVEDLDGHRTAERRLMRSFGPAPTGAKKQMTRDTRLRTTTTFRLPLREATKTRVRVRVLYQRLIASELELPSRRESPRDTVEDEIVVAERVIAEHP